ncbi:terminase small subunit [Dyadobacter flavalbus]|uniref:Terminase small subunit n=1 Tax=Dyadobacter flavalbus TaxID=2579942 RepID=A0A5M8QYZ2_9BACT|nr:terminase small subunit [Dyadobacter flavalbus]KAA6441447.1 terminase small subunit [Dyadobacter flavalbus]
MKKEVKLTAQKKRFCDEYLVCENGKEAAILAGYSAKTAAVQASQMLSEVKVQEYLKEHKYKLDKKLENKYLISKERILEQYAKIAFSDIRGYYDEDGLLKSISALDEDQAVALAGVETFEVNTGGVPIGETKKVKIYDKIRALDSISKVMGYNAEEKSNVRVSVDLTEQDIEMFSKFFNDKYK